MSHRVVHFAPTMAPPRHSHHHHRHHDDNLVHRPSVRLYGDEAPLVAPDFLFCVELGLLVRSRNTRHTDVTTLMNEVSARFRDVGLANHIHYDGTRESHKDWTLVEDRTIPTQPADHRFGMRVVSPFFRFGPGHAETWLPLLDVVMSVLNYDFELTTHHQCNTSVHVVPSRGYWHLSEAKGLATSAIYFERCLDALMPYYRRRTIWAKSNRYNPYMGKRTVSACVAAIHGQATTIRQLAAHMNWCGADTPTGEALGQTSDFPHETFRWNFLAKSLLGGTGDGYRTIEFRQPPGSTDAAEAIKWVMLVGCFARLSCAFSVCTDDKPSLFALGKWVRYEARICGFGRLYVDELKRMFERADVPQFDFSAGRDPEVISSEEGARLRWKETWNCNVGQRKYTELSKKTQKLRSQRA